MNDENMEETTSSESSTETNDSENVTEDEKKSEPMIPKARFDEVNSKKKELEERIAQLESSGNTKPTESNKTPTDEKWKQWTEFAIENRELDREQFAIAKRLFESGVPTSKLLEDPLYVAASEKYLREKAEKDASPTSGRSPKGIHEKPIEEMSEAEMRALHAKLVGKN